MNEKIKNQLKQAALYFGIILIIAALSIVGGIIYWQKSRPNNNNSKMFGEYSVSLAGSFWNSSTRTWVTSALNEMRRLGPNFKLLSADSTERPNIIITSTDLTPCSRNGAARYTLGTNRIEIDLTCVHGEYEVRSAVMHEIGHFLGMSHICRQQEIRECSPVGHGPAIMNPYGYYGDGNDLSSTEVPLIEIQPLDAQEFCRVHNNCR